MTAVLCDLDGVVYRGSRPIPGAKEAMKKLLASSNEVFFITNNSTRTPQATAEKIARITGVDVSGDQVLTSSQAALTLLEPTDAPVLVVGEDGLRDVVAHGGFEVTEDPGAARSVVVGLTRAMTYETISGAMQAILNGARFIATNDDNSFPTEDGLAPGCGAIVAAIAAASDTDPVVAGKPNPAMRDLIRSRIDGDAWIIGDRLETDIALATGDESWKSVLVLSGVTDRETAAGADVDYIVDDFPGAVDLVLGHLEQS